MFTKSNSAKTTADSLRERSLCLLFQTFLEVDERLVGGNGKVVTKQVSLMAEKTYRKERGRN